MNDRREILGWSMYDWANSAFSTTVVAVFAGPYLNNLARAAADGNGLIHLGWLPIRHTSFFFYCVAASVIGQALTLPLIGAIADFSHARKKMLMALTAIGSGSTALLYFATPGWHWAGGLLFITANIAFGGSIVLYYSYLPDIASPENRDRVSSQGFAIGYLGGAILLVLNLLLFFFKEDLGLDDSGAARISLGSAGLWWLAFSPFMFATLRPHLPRRVLPSGQNYIRAGLSQLASTFREMRHTPQTVRYLIAFLLYNDGIQTVQLAAAIFAEEELAMSQMSRILVILMIQVVAFVSAFFYGWLAGKIGAMRAVVSSLVIWSGVVIFAFAGMQDTAIVPGLNIPMRVLEFWILGFIVGIVLGGSQALSRSLFAQMVPKAKEAEYFSFYVLSDRGTSWIGPLVFALVNQWLGTIRYAILSLIVLFVAGLAVLATVNVKRAIDEANP
jgi:UMF1 family MFS transporter